LGVALARRAGAQRLAARQRQHATWPTQQKQREAVLVANAMGASLAGADAEAAAERIGRWQAATAGARVGAGRRRPRAAGIDAAEDAGAAGAAARGKAAVRPGDRTALGRRDQCRRRGVRKKTVQIDDRGDGVVTVTVPYVVDGQFEGIVQARVRSRPGPCRPAAAGRSAWPAGGRRSWSVFFLRVNPQRRFDIGRGIAVVALLALAVGFQQQRLGQMAEAAAAATSPSPRAGRRRRGLRRTGAAPLAPGSRQPLGHRRLRPPARPDHRRRRLGAAGPQQRGQKDTHTRFLERSFWGINLLGLALLLFFVQGWAAHRQALRDHADAYAYVAPAMIGMLVLVFFPFFYGIGLAFTDTTLFNESAAFPRTLDRPGQFRADPG
jgi:arabinogalactan oligomer/maltooligosaccharide transport system permease protein